MKNFPLGFVEVRSTHLCFGFWTNAERFEREKIVQIFFAVPSWILSRGCKSSSWLLVHKDVPGIVQMDRIQSCSNKTAKENEENIIKLDVHITEQTEQ